MIRVVLDTSVLVSAVVSPAGPNAQLFDFIVIEELRPYLTDAVLREYHRVFEYDRLKDLDKRRIARLRGVLKRAGFKVRTSGRLKISLHQDDNRIYECAIAAKADYIVTENARPFKKPYKTTKIITARGLLKLLDGGQAWLIPHVSPRHGSSFVTRRTDLRFAHPSAPSSKCQVFTNQ